MTKNYIFIILIFTACKSTYCPNNEVYIERFKSSLDLVVKSENRNVDVSVESYRNALLFLSNTTGIVTRADYSSTIGYHTKEDFWKDIKSWKKWLQRNKCKLTQDYVDSVMSKTY